MSKSTGRPKRLVTLFGQTLTIEEAIENFNPELSSMTVRQRLFRGWEDEKAIMTPVYKKP